MPTVEVSDKYLDAIAAVPVSDALEDVVQNDHELTVKIAGPNNGVSADFFRFIKMYFAESLQHYLATHDVELDIAVAEIKRKVAFEFPYEDCRGYQMFQQQGMYKVFSYSFAQQ